MQSDDSYRASDLITLFNSCFADSEKTRLAGGADEPLYQPATASCDYHQVIFTQDYFASALHEISHWCIAGLQRRRLVDYGYWYEPDGRDSQQQLKFEAVEAKPQALEWIFSVSCGYPFRVSADNLQGPEPDLSLFRERICEEAQRLLNRGLPDRANVFSKALQQYYQQLTPLAHNFNLKNLR